MIRNLAIAAATATLLSAIPATAKTAEPPVTLAKCERSYGTIAVVDGDTQGWTKYGLGSPRDLIAALASESGCFTPYSQGSGQAANYLMNVIAGDKEEVDKGVSMARTAAVEGLARSGVASRMGGLGGSALGMLGGFGGRRKTVAAGIRLLSPASGQTMISGTGEVTKSSISFGGLGAVDSGASSSGYASSNDGKMLVEAFIKAFNAVSAQGASLSAITPAAAPAAAAGATTAVDTKMFGLPAANAAILRNLRAGSTLKPTGKRQGLFVEVEDNYGTKGWVSVEDLR